VTCGGSIENKGNREWTEKVKKGKKTKVGSELMHELGVRDLYPGKLVSLSKSYKASLTRLGFRWGGPEQYDIQITVCHRE
jgi:hypothetical protein